MNLVIGFVLRFAVPRIRKDVLAKKRLQERRTPGRIEIDARRLVGAQEQELMDERAAVLLRPAVFPRGIDPERLHDLDIFLLALLGAGLDLLTRWIAEVLKARPMMR